jgi:hypothetical protein
MASPNKFIAWMDEYVEEYLRLEPREDFDPCVVGVARRFNDTVLLYDTTKVLAVFVAQGLTEDEAEEHFEYNVIGGWLGDGTPVFTVPGADDDLDLQYE